MNSPDRGPRFPVPSPARFPGIPLAGPVSVRFGREGTARRTPRLHQDSPPPRVPPLPRFFCSLPYPSLLQCLAGCNSLAPRQRDHFQAPHRQRGSEAYSRFPLPLPNPHPLYPATTWPSLCHAPAPTHLRPLAPTLSPPSYRPCSRGRDSPWEGTPEPSVGTKEPLMLPTDK